MVVKKVVKKKTPIELMNEARIKKGNLGGKPLSYSTPEKLELAIEDYFKTITLDKPKIKNVEDGVDIKGEKLYKEEPILNNAGKQIVDVEWLETPSVLGLCLHLKIDRVTLIEYSKREGYTNTIKEAKLIIENYTANLLNRKEQVTGVIFNLKNNFGWVDKQEIDQTTKQINLTKEEWAKLSDEELEKLSNGG